MEILNTIYIVMGIIGTTLTIFVFLRGSIVKSLRDNLGILSLQTEFTKIESKVDSLELTLYKFIISNNIQRYEKIHDELIYKQICEDYDIYKKLGGNSYIDDMIKHIYHQ